MMFLSCKPHACSVKVFNIIVHIVIHYSLILTLWCYVMLCKLPKLSFQHVREHSVPAFSH